MTSRISMDENSDAVLNEGMKWMESSYVDKINI